MYVIAFFSWATIENFRQWSPANQKPNIVLVAGSFCFALTGIHQYALSSLASKAITLD